MRHLPLLLLFLAPVSLHAPAEAQAQAKPGLTLLHAFAPIAESRSLNDSPANADGAEPNGALCVANDGVLYGTATRGGTNGQGTIFRLNPDGTGFQVLHSFQALPTLFAGAPNEDGAYPDGALIQGPEGQLFGTASQGGPGGSGTIYALQPDGTGYHVLHVFSPMHGPYVNQEGGHPENLLFGQDGKLYGATTLGGADGGGVLFALRPDGTGFTILHVFPAVERSHNVNNVNAGGSHPQARLTQDKAGLLYGTTNIGGTSGYGTIFRMSPDGSGFQILHHFARTESGNGSRPGSGCVLGQDGFLYGTTDDGGANDSGVLYKMGVDGHDFKVLHEFSSPRTVSDDGGGPRAPLVLTPGGSLYGSTVMGGTQGSGALFQIAADGTGFQAFHGLENTEGTSVRAALVPGQDGSLYGAAENGGPNGAGSLFRLTLPTANAATP